MTRFQQKLLKGDTLGLAVTFQHQRCKQSHAAACRDGDVYWRARLWLLLLLLIPPEHFFVFLLFFFVFHEIQKTKIWCTSFRKLIPEGLTLETVLLKLYVNQIAVLQCQLSAEQGGLSAVLEWHDPRTTSHDPAVSCPAP